MSQMTQQKELADKIAAAIQDMVTKRRSFPDGGSICIKFGGVGGTVYQYRVRSDKNTVLTDKYTGLPFDTSVIALMKIANAIQAYKHYNVRLSGVHHEIAKYETGDGFANRLGGFVAHIDDEEDDGVIGCSVSGDTQEEDLLCAACGIGIIRDYFDDCATTPTYTDIKDALLASNIIAACSKRGLLQAPLKMPLILGHERLMESGPNSVFMRTLLNHGIEPVPTRADSLKPAVSAIDEFITKPDTRDPKEFAKICNLASDAKLKNDCIVVIGCKDLESTLAAFLRGKDAPPILGIEDEKSLES